MSTTEVDADGVALAWPAADLTHVVEAIARSIERSGGRVVAVSIAGVDRAWSDESTSMHPPSTRDAAERVASTEVRP